VCAYWKCLHSCPCDRDAAAKKDGEKDEGKKNPEDKSGPDGKKNGDKKNGDGEGDKKDKEKEKDKDEKKDDDKGEKKDGDKDKESGKAEEKDKSQWYSAHAQGTVVTQVHDRFRSPYVGPNSLVPVEPAATSETSTLFLAMRLWECGSHSTELVFNPEIAGGRGFSNSSGIAGFPNLEITRVGVPDPTPYIARLFVRQTCGFGGEQEKVEDGPNQVAGTRDIDRITLTVGKFAATDLVDDNRYSHDGRTQFMPWSFGYNGAWDYPANVRGYTYGVGIELNRKNWALRYGIWAEPEFANSAPLDPHFTKAFGQVVELEERYTLCDHPGKVRLLAYLNRAHMGDYSEALAAMPVNPDVTQTRDYRYKYGFGLSWEQELTKNLGVWARLGWDDGHTESWAFTAIDRLAEIGLLLNGRCWCRPNDQVGLAVGANGLAKSHRDYLAAGGLDFIIGDGRLNYGPEEILELYYNLEVIKGINVTADFQGVNHPAYNRDRGPVAVGSLRVHFEF
jgi:high affinity Mn2+ porin